MANKTKIKELLNKLDSLESAYFPDTSSLTEKLINDEMTSIRDKVKDNPTIKALEKLNEELKKIKESSDVKPVIALIKELEKDLDTALSELVSDFDSKISALDSSIKETKKQSDVSSSKKSQAILEMVSNFKDELEKKIDSSRFSDLSINKEISAVKTSIADITKSISDTSRFDSINKSFKTLKSEREKLEKDTEDKIVALRTDFLNRIAGLGGGSQNRQIKVDGTDPLTRYTDINFVAGTGISITTSNDDSDKNVDITFSAGTLSPITPTGTVNGVNQVFTFTTAPAIIVVDQGRVMQKTSSDGSVNWTGTTTVTLTIAPNSDIFGI